MLFLIDPETRDTKIITSEYAKSPGTELVDACLLGTAIDFIITDTHFNHKNMVKYENRPENFNELIIDNWQSKVKDKDVILHLGDVILGHDGELLTIMRKLPGFKILIKGNHDKKPQEWYLRNGFDVVLPEGAAMIDTKSADFVFSHKPLLASFMKQYNDELLVADRDSCFMNIHGHLHTSMGYPYDTKGIEQMYYNASGLFERTLSPVGVNELRELIRLS